MGGTCNVCELAQAGSDSEALTYSFLGTLHYYTQYNGFIEFWPNNKIGISNFSIAPNDYLENITWVGDSSGNESLSGSYVWTYLYNYRTNTSVTTNAGRPSGTFYGESAEWVLEDPSGTMPTFDDTQMDYPEALATDWNSHDWDSDSSLLVTSVSPTTHDTLADAWLIDPYSSNPHIHYSFQNNN